LRRGGNDEMGMGWEWSLGMFVIVFGVKSEKTYINAGGHFSIIEIVNG
jgi:hypothetical protein